jgi:hypothetical protein
VSERYHTLRVFNLVMAALHAAQGVAVIYLSTNFHLPITYSYLVFNRATQHLDSATSTLVDVRFGYGVALFFFLSALFHLFIATEYFEHYKADLARHVNIVRWIEYALSASVMMVLIAMLAGVYDTATLLLIFGATAVMNLCGLVMELVNQNRAEVNWSAYIVGAVAGILPWLAILIYFIGSASQANNATPTFVYYIYGSIFVFFNCFAINMYLQYKKVGPWHNYLYGETVYIILSLVAKSLLAWQVFAGTLRP